jgi:hypothetical protein
MLKKFVHNRVKESRRTDVDYRFVPGDMNPADIPSHGCTADELRESEDWWYGPKFLQGPENEWPENKIPDKMEEESEIEDWRDVVVSGTVTVIQAAEARRVRPLITAERFSKWKRMNRAIMYVLRYLKLKLEKSAKARDFFERIGMNTEYYDQNSNVLAGELVVAERVIIKQCQLFYPPDEKEIVDLRKVESVEGVLVCMGRFGFPAEYPLFMSGKARETVLMVMDSLGKENLKLEN